MKNKRLAAFRTILMMTAAVCATASVRADVVILSRGDRLEGIVTPAPGKSDAIVFQNHKTRMEISRSRIRTVEEEPDSVDWRRIGDQFFNDRHYESALEAYRKSAKFDPNDSRTAEQIKAAELALTRESTLERRRELEKITGMLQEAEQRIEEKNFAGAEALLTSEIPALKPVPDQEKRMVELRKKLYKAWAVEKEDKLLPSDAAAYFEKLLALDPLDTQARDRLIAIWEKMPEKTPQVLEAYKVHLKLNPQDNVVRRKLADKYIETARAAETRRTEEPAGDRTIDATYESAVEMYEMLRGADASLPQDVADKVALCLTSLYRRAEDRKDYEQAVRHYKHLQVYSKKAADDMLHTLEFRRDALKLKSSDVDALTTLILRARSQGLEDLAREQIRAARKRFPENKTVENVLKMYAEESLAKAKGYLQTLQYEKAESLANECAREYGSFPDVKQRAEQILNLAQVEREKERRRGGEEARKYKELGDTAYAQGSFHLNAMSTTDYTQVTVTSGSGAIRHSQTDSGPQVRVISHKNEAIRYFREAIRDYDLALTKWISIDAATRQEIQGKRSDAQRHLNVLTSQTPIELPRGPSRR